MQAELSLTKCAGLAGLFHFAFLEFADSDLCSCIQFMLDKYGQFSIFKDKHLTLDQGIGASFYLYCMNILSVNSHQVII